MTTMPYGNYRHIPITIKQQIVALSPDHSTSAIASALHVAPRTVRRVVRLATLTGDVVTKRHTTGRPRILSSLDLAVS